MNAESPAEDRIAALEQRASVTSDSIGGLRVQMIEILARVGRVEGAVGEIRADVDQMATSLIQIKEALVEVKIAGELRAEAAKLQSAAVLDLLGRAIDGRTTIEQAQIAAKSTTDQARISTDGTTKQAEIAARGIGVAEIAKQAAPIVGAVGGLAGALAAAWSALR